MNTREMLVFKFGVSAGLALIAVVVLAALILEGVVPRAQAEIPIEAPLYPSPFYYREEVSVSLGRGLYTITVYSHSHNLTICVSSGGTVFFFQVPKGAIVEKKLWVERGAISLTVVAAGKPYQRLLGVVKVERAWR